MKAAPLTVIKDGINRLRTKGGARADSLYDLVNAVVTKSHTVKQRPGTMREASLPAGTVGLVGFEGKLHVFADSEVDLSGFDDFELHILLHPTDSTAELERIHFAKPYLGKLYVVAEFDDGGIFHYWLQDGQEWEASTEYSANEFVIPTTANGFVYRATRFGQPYQAWGPGVLRTAGNGSSIEPSRIEPTEYNEYYYEAIDTEGTNPRSGSSEPSWPTNSGQTIIENTDGIEVTDPGDIVPPDPPAPNTPQATTTERY